MNDNPKSKETIDIHAIVDQLQRAYDRNDYSLMKCLLEKTEEAVFAMDDEIAKTKPQSIHYLDRLDRLVDEYFEKLSCGERNEERFDYDEDISRYLDLGLSAYCAVFDREKASEYVQRCLRHAPYGHDYNTTMLNLGSFSGLGPMKERAEFYRERIARDYEDLGAYLAHFANNPCLNTTAEELADCIQAINDCEMSSIDFGGLYDTTWDLRYESLEDDNPGLNDRDYSWEALQERHKEYGHPAEFSDSMIDCMKSILKDAEKSNDYEIGVRVCCFLQQMVDYRSYGQKRKELEQKQIAESEKKKSEDA